MYSVSKQSVSGHPKIIEVELQKGQLIPAHHHEDWVEHCYCLSGELVVYLDGNFKVPLKNGEKLEINNHASHKICNVSDGVSHLLIVQNAVAAQ